MARNGSGTYSVPNTFVSGQTITASSHNSNWSDIGTEITNSVAADGQTTITAGLKGANGTVSLPSYSFASDLDSGIYRIGANNIGVGVNAAKVLDIGTGGLTVTGTLAATSDFAININKFTVTASSGNTSVGGTLAVTGTSTHTDVVYAPNGAVGAPAYAFTNDTDCGIYRIGTNNLGVAVNGAKEIDIATTGTTFTHAVTVGSGFTVSAGAVSLPAGSVANAALAAPGAIVFLATASPSTVATQAFTAFSSTYDDYIFEIANLVPATDDVALYVQISVDGGSNWKTSGYLSSCQGVSSSGTATALSSTAAFGLGASAGGASIGNDSGYGFSGTVKIFGCNHSSNIKNMAGYGTYLMSTGSATQNLTAQGGGFWNSSTTAVNAIRFLFASGNITSGTIRMYGIVHA